jgi:hypothetical protein
MVHVDIKKLGRIPDGGGWRMVGRTQGQKNTTRGRIGYDFIHSAVDDCSRLAYSEIRDDERKETCAEFWTNAEAFFAAHGITVTRVLTDNGSRTAVSSGRRRSARSPTSAHGHTGLKPTAKSSDSTGPCSPSGPMSARMNQPAPGLRNWTTGSTPTTINDATPPSTACHPSNASTTSLGNTASRWERHAGTRDRRRGPCLER